MNLELATQNSEEALWVVQAANGDVLAFESLYRKTHKRLLMFCLRLLNEQSMAEEIVQETYIKAWQGIAGFRLESQFYTWLRTIASRLSIDRLRSKSEKIWQNQVLDQVDLGEVRSNSETALDLENLISRLPDGARAVLVMFDVEGYSHTEIASILGIAEGTSKAQLSRARGLIKAALVEK